MDRSETLLIVYFAYGLSFFSMGLVLALESARTSSIELGRLLKPLALFGLLHGVNEWLEVFVIQSKMNEVHLPVSISWFQLGLLTTSFIALAAYGIQAFRTLRDYFNPLTYFGIITLPIYAIVITVDVILSHTKGNFSAELMVGALVRYLLAVPSAALATIGLNAGATRAQANKRIPLNVYLNWAAVGFAIYSVTQLFVPTIPTFFASRISAEGFYALTGIPIQAVRTIVGIVITISMFASMNFLEKERQDEQLTVQKMRMEVMEQQEQLRKELLRNTILTQEEERARIARELHDEMAQTLTAFTLDLGTLQHALPNESGAHLLLDRLQNLSRQMSQDMYQMVYMLRPPHLDELGLIAALKYSIERDFQSRGLNVKMVVNGDPARVAPSIETVLFRIAQEALTNVLRHANTREVSLNLEYEPNKVSLKISDHGTGFDTNQNFTAPRGWGLAGIKERTESVGGKLQVQSGLHQGTAIEVEIPISPRQAG